MKSKLAVLVSYFGFTSLFVFVVVFYSVYYYHNYTHRAQSYPYVHSENIRYSALPDTSEKVAIQIDSHEARVDALNAFFERHDSPLIGMGQKFVSEADKNALDYRLLASIAMQESNLCKKELSSAPFNCWGFGIYGKKRTGFESYNEAISVISKAMAEKYISYGYETPDEIMTKYTPGSNGSWAKGVYFFMNQIDQFML